MTFFALFQGDTNVLTRSESASSASSYAGPLDRCLNNINAFASEYVGFIFINRLIDAIYVPFREFYDLPKLIPFHLQVADRETRSALTPFCT